jgi:hypothetical protein
MFKPQNCICTGQTSETDVHPTSRAIHATEYHEVLEGSLAGTVLILIWYCVSFSKALIPQLQLWHLHWLVSVQPMGRWPAFTSVTGIAGVIPQSPRHFKWQPSAWVSQTLQSSYLSHMTAATMHQRPGVHLNPPTCRYCIGRQHTISTFHADDNRSVA